jgi:sugar diacid utilization regulator
VGADRRGVDGLEQLSRENRVLRELVAVYRHLSGLAAQHSDLGAVVQLIADRTSATVGVVGHDGEVLAAAAPATSPAEAAGVIGEFVVDERVGRVLVAAGQTRRALRLPAVAAAGSAVVAPVLVGDEVACWVLTLDPVESQFAGQDVSLLLSEHAATILGVILGRERVVAAAASRARDDLVEGLLSGRGDAEQTGRWAAHLGYDPGVDHHVLSVVLEVAGEVPGGGLRRVGEAVEQAVAGLAGGVITLVREAEVVVVVAEPPGGKGGVAGKVGQVCLSRVRELSPGGGVVATVGIGGRCHDPGEVARSYGEARRTIEMVWRMGRRGGVVAFESLDVHRLLLQVPDVGELRGFAMGVLGKLSVHEREHKSEYLTTLACYFRENNSPQRASRVLHVHPNTVTYRVRRIEEITGLDFDNYRDRLMAQVALEILDAVGDGL